MPDPVSGVGLPASMLLLGGEQYSGEAPVTGLVTADPGTGDGLTQLDAHAAVVLEVAQAQPDPGGEAVGTGQLREPEHLDELLGMFRRMFQPQGVERGAERYWTTPESTPQLSDIMAKSTPPLGYVGCAR